MMSLNNQLRSTETNQKNSKAKYKEQQNGYYEWQNITQEHQFTLWDSRNNRFKKTKFQITFTKEKEIQYIKDGQILRTELVIDSFYKPDILTNLEQINFLQWSGKYGQNSLKVGQWTATWNNETIQEVGGYYNRNIKNYNTLSMGRSKAYGRNQPKIIGLKPKSMKRGIWKYIYKNNEIGGGFYDEQSQKNGKWIELSDNFWNQGYVVYAGEYKNGKKYGVWNVLHKRKGQKQLKYIACGSYNNMQESCAIVDSVKVGKWIELNDGFWDFAQILHMGDYKDGKKVDRWDILYRIRSNKPFEIIGGGLYETKLESHVVQGSLKIGRWIELIEGFWRDNQVTYNGKYHNGIKVGKWDIFYYDEDAEKYELIGGGSYAEKMNDQEIVGSVKIGKWIELSDGFGSESQVTYKGEYENGKKVGRWDIFYKDEQIGGGQYDKVESDLLGDSIKIGKWIELIEGFYEYGQVTYCGEYMNGKKVGIAQKHIIISF